MIKNVQILDETRQYCTRYQSYFRTASLWPIERLKRAELWLLVASGKLREDLVVHIGLMRPPSLLRNWSIITSIDFKLTSAIPALVSWHWKIWVNLENFDQNSTFSGGTKEIEAVLRLLRSYPKDAYLSLSCGEQGEDKLNSGEDLVKVFQLIKKLATPRASYTKFFTIKTTVVHQNKTLSTDFQIRPF